MLAAGGRRRWGTAAALLALGGPGFWSLPVVADALRLSLEGRFPNLPIAGLPTADAIVVLGGGITAGLPDRPYPDLVVF